jgi:hypothetical protein
VDAAEVGAGGAKARQDRVADAVFTAKKDHRTRFGRGVAVGQGAGGGQAAGQIQGHKGFALAGVAVHQGEFADRQSARPEPIKGFIRKVVKTPNELGGIGRHEGCSENESGTLLVEEVCIYVCIVHVRGC